MEEAKLIYVLKVGTNTKEENIFEFIFSDDITNINPNQWGWDEIPASDFARPPTTDYIKAIYTIKTKNLDLFCLHEATDREYMHGYHTIHALAYEIENDDYDSYDEFNDKPLLVFHYGMSYKIIKDLLESRNIKMKEL